MPPLVSILIPAYNAGKWIGQTVESALCQTWQQKEIIVVDDGSRDASATIAKRYSARGVRVIVQENQGASAARNHAYRLSRGDYIQWLDADDLLAPDKIERQLEVLGSAGVTSRTLLSSPWAYFAHRPQRSRFAPTRLCEDLTPAEWLARKMGENLHMQTATWLTSRELCEAAGPWDTSISADDDGEYYCRVLMACDGVRFVPGPAVYYRISGYSRLSYIGASDRKLEAQLRSMRLHIGYLRSLEDTPRTRQACLRYLQNWLIHFFPNRPDLVAQMRGMADELGGSLTEPVLSWKYAWLRTIFGWNMAKQAQLFLPRLRGTATLAAERVIALFDRPRIPGI